MSRTIVGRFLAFALAIAPASYCAQSWAGSLIEPAAREAEEAASKAVEKLKAWWEKLPEPVKDKVKGLPSEALVECAEEAAKDRTCEDTPK